MQDDDWSVCGAEKKEKNVLFINLATYERQAWHHCYGQIECYENSGRFNIRILLMLLIKSVCFK